MISETFESLLRERPSQVRELALREHFDGMKKACFNDLLKQAPDARTGLIVLPSGIVRNNLS